MSNIFFFVILHAVIFLLSSHNNGRAFIKSSIAAINYISNLNYTYPSSPRPTSNIQHPTSNIQHTNTDLLVRTRKHNHEEPQHEHEHEEPRKRHGREHEHPELAAIGYV